MRCIWLCNIIPVEYGFKERIGRCTIINAYTKIWIEIILAPLSSLIAVIFPCLLSNLGFHGLKWGWGSSVSGFMWAPPSIVTRGGLQVASRNCGANHVKLESLKCWT